MAVYRIYKTFFKKMAAGTPKAIVAILTVLVLLGASYLVACLIAALAS